MNFEITLIVIITTGGKTTGVIIYKLALMREMNERNTIRLARVTLQLELITSNNINNKKYNNINYNNLLLQKRKDNMFNSGKRKQWMPATNITTTTKSTIYEG